MAVCCSDGTGIGRQGAPVRSGHTKKPLVERAGVDWRGQGREKVPILKCKQAKHTTTFLIRA